MVKPLLPTLKEKKRYLVYEIISKKKIDKDISFEIVKKATSFLGVFDAAKAGLRNVKYDVKKQKGVIKVSHKQLAKLKTSLALVNEINNEEVNIHTIGVSGILKKAKDKYVAI